MTIERCYRTLVWHGMALPTITVESGNTRLIEPMVAETNRAYGCVFYSSLV